MNSPRQNRTKAYRVLRARLLDRRLQAEQDERRSVRRTQVRGTDRSEKIRTYNFPQVRSHFLPLHFSLLAFSLRRPDAGVCASSSGRFGSRERFPFTLIADC